MPSVFIPHGGGPSFFMEWDPPELWDNLGRWLRDLPSILPRVPRALLVVSAHWEAPKATLTSHSHPPLIYDYSGFPAHTYQLQWPAPGDPALAQRVSTLLDAAGIANTQSPTQGFDHGVFIPLLLSYPQANIPTVQLSLCTGLDPAHHLRIGAALTPLRADDVLIIGSGFSYHNLRAMLNPGHPDIAEDSMRFDHWLTHTVESDPEICRKRLVHWQQAPSAQACHPRSEHLIPLMVAAGAADKDRGSRIFHEQLGTVTHSAYRFG
jgi:aromatic ring-opening dioxygenase catalytic subunit (LigB family)